MADDPLAALADLPGVGEAAQRVRDAVDSVHLHPANRRGWPTTAAEAAMRAARASAALDGANPRLPDLWAAQPWTADPSNAEPSIAQASIAQPSIAQPSIAQPSTGVDPILAGAVRVAEAIGPLLATWQRAPLQALARLHVLAAADLAGDDTLGRPRAEDEVSARLNLLARTMTARSVAPGVVQAAVVHAELLALAPFGVGNGVVARAAARLTAVATGLDSKGLAVPEVGHLRWRDGYAQALAGYRDGTTEGVTGWLLHCCDAWLAGAREARNIAEALVTR